MGSSKASRPLPRILRRSTRFEAAPDDEESKEDKAVSKVSSSSHSGHSVIKNDSVKQQDSLSSNSSVVHKDSQGVLSTNKTRLTSSHGSSCNNIRRYCCPRCPYSTDRRDLFTRHENIHRDEKPFRCYICNKMFNRADHVKKHFLRIHKGIDYDAKLTKRIKGIDYSADDGLEFESLDKSLGIKLGGKKSPDHVINGNILTSTPGLNHRHNDVSLSPRDNGSHEKHLVSNTVIPTVSSASILSTSLTGSRPTLLSSELMARILEGNQMLSKQSVQNLSGAISSSGNEGINGNSHAVSTGPMFGSSASNLSALFPLDSSTLKSQPLFLSGADHTKWPKMQEVISRVPSKEVTCETRVTSPRQEGQVASQDVVVSDDDSEDMENETSYVSSDDLESMSSSSSSFTDSPVVRQQTKAKSGLQYKVLPERSHMKYKTKKAVTQRPSSMSTFSSQVVNMDTDREDISQYDCDVCGCTFKDFSSLHTHRYLLHQHVSQVLSQRVLPYECLLCHRKFSAQRAITDHMKTHTSLTEREIFLINEAARRSNQEINANQNDTFETSHGSSEGGSRRKQFIPRKIVKSDEEEEESDTVNPDIITTGVK